MTVPEDERYESRYHQQERLWALHKEAARFFHSQLYSPVGKPALDYALGRGMSKAILTAFGVGYAPDSWDSMVKAMRAKGYTDEELERPLIGVVSAFSEIVPGHMNLDKLAEAVKQTFDLRPAKIISYLDLRRPIYSHVAAYGHFGRPELDLPWERTDRVDELKSCL